MLDKFMKKCYVCGKPFYCDNMELWAYKIGKVRKNKSGTHIKSFCSWRCMREYERRQNEPHKAVT